MGFPEPALWFPFLPQGSARQLHWMFWPMSSGRNYYPISFPCSRAFSSTLSGWSRNQASWCWELLLRVSALPACLHLTSDLCADVRLGLVQAGLPEKVMPSLSSLQRPVYPL